MDKLQQAIDILTDYLVDTVPEGEVWDNHPIDDARTLLQELQIGNEVDEEAAYDAGYEAAYSASYPPNGDEWVCSVFPAGSTLAQAWERGFRAGYYNIHH